MTTETIVAIDLNVFRNDVRNFFSQAIPEDIAHAMRAHVLANKTQAMRWQAILAQQGWGAPNWPTDMGGTGWTLEQQAIFRQELALVAAPHVDNLGLEIIGPTIIRHGTVAQKNQFLPDILWGRSYWAQAYSESNAGSDLASLRTSAFFKNGEWVVNGAKIWQSYGHWADWALTLVRTGTQTVRKQDGMSILLIDLKSPGVTIRPIRYIHGGILHVEIFFDNVRVPDDQRLGEAHTAWNMAKDLLIVERIFTARAPEAASELARMARAQRHDGSPVLHNAEFKRQHLRHKVRLQALDALWWPTLQTLQEGGQPMLMASVCKLEGTLLFQDIHQLWIDAHGLDALFQTKDALEGTPSSRPASPDHAENFMPHYWRYRGITLGGGTAEIQKGIIAKALFNGQTDVEIDGLQTSGLKVSDELRTIIDAVEKRLTSVQYADSSTRDQAVAALELRGMCIDIKYGGFGLGMLAAAHSTQLFGEHLVQEQVLWPSMIIVNMLKSFDNVLLSAQRLRGLIRDEMTIAWAHQESSQVSEPQKTQTQLRQTADGCTLSGTKHMVMGLGQATHLWLSACDVENQLVLLEVPISSQSISIDTRTLQDGRNLSKIKFTEAPLKDVEIIARGSQARDLIQQGQATATLLVCLDSIGAMRSALKLTLEHLRNRQQFGQPLAQFQVIQHRMADHYRQWSMAKALALEVASEWSDYTQTQRVQRSSATKWYVNQIGRNVALDTIQLHGAIGLQHESRISHIAKRLMDNSLIFGNEQYHECVLSSQL